jgi:hypothetical protein
MFVPDWLIRRMLAGVIGFSFGGMYVGWVKAMGPVFWFLPWMQTPLW